MTVQPATAKIDADAFQAEAANFFKATGKTKVLTHAEILSAILGTLDKIDFHVHAGLEKGDPLPQKHLIVICVNELLRQVKEQNLDLARKDDFIFAFNGACWKEFSRETIKYFLGKVAARLSVLPLEAQHYEFQNKLYLQFLAAAYFEPIQPRSDKVLINLQNGTFEITIAAFTIERLISKV